MKQKKKISGTAKELSTKSYYLLYTLIFSFLSLCIFSFFLYHGKSLVASDDGIMDGVIQHLTSLAYYGEYLREIIRNLWINHTLEIPTYDPNIGFGGDILTTLSNYVIGDPLTVLSVFFPMQYTEYLYGFLILLRLYLAGSTFSMYCRYQGNRTINTLTGSMIYIFSAFPLIIAPQHPFFINPMIYLPLLLLCADKMLKNEKKSEYYYTAVICIAALSNFYFFYMLCVMVFIYTVFRYFMIYNKILWKETCKMIFRFIFYSLLGIGMASILFLPSIMNILSSTRLSVDNYIPMFYEPHYYLHLLSNFSSSLIAGHYSYLGYTALGFLSVALLFLKRKEEKVYRYLSIAFTMFLLFLCIPYFGHVLNGMAYVTNRWIWAMSFLVSLIIVYMLPLLRSLSTEHRNKLLVISAIYACLLIGIHLIRSERSLSTIAFLSAILLVIILFQSNPGKADFSHIMLVITMGMLWMNALFMYSPSENNFVSKFADVGTGIDLIQNNAPGAVLKEVDDPSTYRYDTAAVSSKNIRDNSAMLLHKKSTSFYFSSGNVIAAKLISELSLNTTLEQKYRDMNKRAYLDALVGAKYCIVSKGSEKYLPYGYNRLIKSGETYAAYATDYALPLCFTSDKWIPSDTFAKYNVTQKQQALLQGIVVEDAGNMPQANVTFSDSTRPYAIKTDAGVTKDGNCFHVTKDGATVTLTWDGLTNSENYLIFDNIHFTAKNPYDTYSKEDRENMSRYERNQLKTKYRYYEEPTAARMQIKMGNRYDILELRNNHDAFYCNIHDFLVNMGYSAERQSSITLTFHEIGDYTFDNLSVVCQPMDQFQEQCNALKRNAPTELEYGTNQIKTSLSLDCDKLVCFSIPWNAGWSATVNGQKADLVEADGMYMALKLNKGTHDIVLHYHTPYLKNGVWISLFSIGIYLFLIGIGYRHKNKKKTNIAL